VAGSPEAVRAFERLRLGMTEAEVLDALGEAVIDPPHHGNSLRCLGPACGPDSSLWPPDRANCAAAGVKREAWELVGRYTIDALFDKGGTLVGYRLLEPPDAPRRRSPWEVVREVIRW
jgi:hypothetical protein